ncbi:MAG: AAA family ATPase [Bacteroidota bacterium]
MELQKLFNNSAEFLAISLPDYKRELYGTLSWEDGCVAIIGPRGVGKTTLLLQRLQSLALPSEEALYADLGDLFFVENRLIDFAQTFANQGGRYLFLDEVHRYPHGTWAQEIKAIYDRLRQKLKIVFTGSSLLKILNDKADLSRRVLSYRLAGLSFRAYLQLNHKLELPIIALEDLLFKRSGYIKKNKAIIDQIHLGQFSTYLKSGYYPFFLEKKEGYNNRLNAIVRIVLESDMQYLNEESNNLSIKLSRLLAAIADRVPFKPNLSKLAERLELNRNRLTNYLDILERAQLIIGVKAESKGLSSVGKPDKIYLDNPNLIYALSPQHAKIGSVRETFFINQLSQLTHSIVLNPPHISVPKSGDFVFKKGDKRFVFEVGGPSKKAKQIDLETGANYLAVDELNSGVAHRIPLWMFGLLY